MEDPKVVGARILELVTNTPSKTILGAKLKKLVGDSVPGFDPLEYGCRNLRDFIRQHASPVFEVGRSGADVVYGVTVERQSGMLAQSIIASANRWQSRAAKTSVWKTFVSPNGNYRLFGNPETSEVQALPVRVAPPG